MLALVALLFAGACGPASSSSAITEAELALESAEAAEAHRFAAYTYWSATNYLKKAKEIEGHSLYEGSVDYAVRSMELALRSIEETKEFHHQEKLRRERLKTGAKRKKPKKGKKKSKKSSKDGSRGTK